MFDDAIFRTRWPVEHFDTLDSTNSYAVKLSETGQLGPCWIHADKQTRGRGRLSRAWDSLQGNLSATALFPYPGSLAEAPLVCFAAGLAVSDTIDKLYPKASHQVRLKWPNDLVAAHSKIAGILIETGSAHTKTWMAVGIGVNLLKTPAALERPTTALADLPGETIVPPTVFLAELDKSFRTRMADLGASGFSTIRGDWLRRTVHTGGMVSYLDEGEERTAAFVTLADDGALVVRAQDGDTHHIRAGDVGLIG